MKEIYKKCIEDENGFVYADYETKDKTVEEVMGFLVKSGFYDRVANIFKYHGDFCEFAWKYFIQDYYQHYEIYSKTHFNKILNYIYQTLSPEDIEGEVYLLLYKAVYKYMQYKRNQANIIGYLRYWMPVYYLKWIRHYSHEMKRFNKYNDMYHPENKTNYIDIENNKIDIINNKLINILGKNAIERGIIFNLLVNGSDIRLNKELKNIFKERIEEYKYELPGIISDKNLE